MDAPLLIGSPEDLDVGALLAIADGRRVELEDGLLQAIAAGRQRALDTLNADEPVYGVNTGMGAASEIRLDNAAQLIQQDNLMLARAVGSAPWLDTCEARAAVAARLRSFLNGEAGVSPGLCVRLTEILNRDLQPAIPRGRLGAAGEIIPLAHLGGALTGSGEFLGADGAVPAPGALEGAGLEPFRLGPKEGVALIEGVPVTTALAILRVRAARSVAEQTVAVLAAGLALIGANREPFEADVARSNPELGVVLGAVRRLVGTDPHPRSLQAPLSFRIAGPAVAHLLRSIDALERAVDRALDGVTDSPALLGGRFVGTAGFDGFDLAASLDGLRLSLIHCAEASAARLHRLLDERVTGLPRQLSGRPGLHGGMVAVHKRAVGVTHALVGAARPVSIGVSETSLGQEDVQSFSVEAAVACGDAIDAVRDVLACELLAVNQAIHLIPGAPSAWGAELQALLAAVVGLLPEGTADRPFGREVAKLSGLLATGWAEGLLVALPSNPGE